MLSVLPLEPEKRDGGVETADLGFWLKQPEPAKGSYEKTTFLISLFEMCCRGRDGKNG